LKNLKNAPLNQILHKIILENLIKSKNKNIKNNFTLRTEYDNIYDRGLYWERKKNSSKNTLFFI